MPRRILYMAGPGSVIGTYRHWRDAQDDPSQVAVTYSGQFFNICKDLGCEGRVISYCPEGGREKDGCYDVEHRPVPMQNWRGPFFHLGWYLFNLSICWTAIRDRCDVLVLMTGTHLWPYWPAKWLGKKIILTQHCVVWPKNLGQRGLWKVVHRLDRRFFQKGGDAILSMSKDITDQINELTEGKHPLVDHFLPSYRENSFADIQTSDHTKRPFRVLFAGRAEANKGVFDLIEIGRRLKRDGHIDVVIDIAGDGGAMAEMQKQVKSEDLQDLVVLHGYCQKPKMRQLMSACHAVILPTKADMIEGFNKVVAEAVLAHRPWITSHLCPAIEYVREAGVEVPPDDVQAYLDAILKLASDEALYRKKVTAAHELSAQFYDQDRGWAATLKRALGLDQKVSGEKLVSAGS